MSATYSQRQMLPKSIEELSTTIKRHIPDQKVELLSTLLILFGALLAVIVVIDALLKRFGAAQPASNSSGGLTANISLREMFMLGVLAVLFTTLGAFLRSTYNGMRTKLLLEALKIQGELNSQLHRERLAETEPAASVTYNGVAQPVAPNQAKQPPKVIGASNQNGDDFCASPCQWLLGRNRLS